MTSSEVLMLQRELHKLAEQNREDHKLVRKALEYNAGKQRVALCLSDDCEPPALDAILCVPIDPHDEHAPIEIWDVMVEVAAVADNLERQLSSTDEL